MRIYFLTVFLFLYLIHHSQIRVDFKFEEKPLIFGEKYNVKNDSSWVQVDELKFYIVYSPFFSDETTAASSIIHLVDITDSSTYYLPYTEVGMKYSSTFDFALGLDSATTISTQFSGALDPALGMYWAWNTGYIHFKLEGKSNLCFSKNQEFQYHIGGYSGKFSTQRWLNSKIILKDKIPSLEIDVADYFREVVNLNEKPLIMIPGKEAVFMADNYYRLFK